MVYPLPETLDTTFSVPDVARSRYAGLASLVIFWLTLFSLTNPALHKVTRY